MLEPLSAFILVKFGFIATTAAVTATAVAITTIAAATAITKAATAAAITTSPITKVANSEAIAAAPSKQHQQPNRVNLSSCGLLGHPAKTSFSNRSRFLSLLAF